MVFNARANAKYRAIGFYGEPDMEASFSKATPNLLGQSFAARFQAEREFLDTNDMASS
jgi:hypothetical protein